MKHNFVTRVFHQPIPFFPQSLRGGEVKHSRNEVGSDVVDTGSLAKLFKARLLIGKQTQTRTSFHKTRFRLNVWPHAFSFILWRGIGTASHADLGSTTTRFRTRRPNCPFWPATIHWKKMYLAILQQNDCAHVQQISNHHRLLDSNSGHYIGTFCCFSVVASDWSLFDKAG